MNGNVIHRNGIWPATLRRDGAQVERHLSGSYGIEPARSTALDRHDQHVGSEMLREACDAAASL